MSTTTSTPKPKKIKALIGLDPMPDATVTPLLDSSLQGLTAHADIYTALPVDLKTYGGGITNYKTAITAALDGGKTATAQKNKLKRAVVKMYTLNAHYVEANCNDDIATFLLSGYQPASTSKTPAQPLPLPVIKSIVQGPNAGQLKVTVKPVPKVASYYFRYAAIPTGGAPQGPWIEQAVASKKPVIFSNLTPGTMYTFQVKALGLAGFTDYSDAVNRIVT